MEIRQLRSFVVLAEERHFGRAAARLHVAQPALTKRIQQLEAGIGVPLFARTRKAVRLTAATRDPAAHGLSDLQRYITYGASPRASINLVLTARALAFVRGRDYDANRLVDRRA